jgi:hypothetical protein
VPKRNRLPDTTKRIAYHIISAISFLFVPSRVSSILGFRSRTFNTHALTVTLVLISSNETRRLWAITSGSASTSCTLASGVPQTVIGSV